MPAGDESFSTIASKGRFPVVGSCWLNAWFKSLRICWRRILCSTPSPSRWYLSRPWWRSLDVAPQIPVAPQLHPESYQVSLQIHWRFTVSVACFFAWSHCRWSLFSGFKLRPIPTVWSSQSWRRPPRWSQSCSHSSSNFIVGCWQLKS